MRRGMLTIRTLVVGLAVTIIGMPPTLATTIRVSVASGGTQANGSSWNPAMSSDGRYIAFDSSSNNLIPVDTNGAEDVFVHDRLTGVTERVSMASDGSQANSHSWCSGMSADGRFVLFA